MNLPSDPPTVDRASLKIAVVDDDLFVISQLSHILAASGFTVVGTARDGDQVLELVKTTHPDVILMDIRMERMSGIDATIQLRRSGYRVKVIALTSFDTESTILDATQSGVDGFLGKTAGPTDYVNAIEQVALGYGALSPFATKVVLEAHRRKPSVPQDHNSAKKFEQLTDKEREAVVHLVNTGGQNIEIARVMHVSETSVKAYLSSATAKVGASNRTQLALWAQQVGLHQGARTF